MTQDSGIRQALGLDKPSRFERDEHGLVLFSRMVSRRAVWVDSLVNQRVFIQSIGLDDEGEMIAYDAEGNDRRVEEYMLSPRGER